MTTTKINRDKIEELTQKFDTGNLLAITHNLHRQLEEIVNISDKWNIPFLNPKNILIIGMGGSAIGGDLIKSYSMNNLGIPVEICRTYSVPAYVGPETLCIASSYSGNTEEVLSATNECIKRNAVIIAVSTGGELEKIAHTNKNTFCKIPTGLQPRAALGYSFASIYCILSKAGILKETPDALKKTSDFLKKISSEWSSWAHIEQNPPLQLAVEVQGKLPIIYSSAGYSESMAYRWKCQFNENSKMLAYCNVFPELNHNEIVGWDADKELLQKMFVIILRDGKEHNRIKLRIDLTKQLIEKNVRIKEIIPQGETDLEKMFYMILFGDITTIYAALLRQKDPSEIESIHWLKDELAKLG
jgi:glucose/mannose-6-phosphate isomerase